MNKKIIVCVDARSLRFEGNGLSRYLRELIYAILNQSNNFKFILISNRNIIFEHEKHNLYNIIIDNSYSYLPGTIWLQYRANVLAKKHNTDIFWSPMHISPILKLKKTKYILTVHDLVMDILPNSMELKNKIINTFLFKLSLKSSDYIICDTKTTLKDLEYFYPFVLKKNTSIVYLGKSLHDLPNLHPISKLKDNAFIFTLGSLEPRKNIMFLIKSFEILLNKFPNLKLHITGAHGWKNNEIISYIEQNKLINSVVLTGFLTDEEIKKQFYSCAVFIFPSLYEGFGLPLLEAENKAVTIASDIEVFQELGEYFENIHFIDFVNCPKNTADKIADVLQMDIKNILKFKTEKYKQLFTWENSATIMIKKFNQLLNEK